MSGALKNEINEETHTVAVACETMDVIYRDRLDATERQRIERLEIFDEFEEWNLL